jgi:hypothetical protein
MPGNFDDPLPIGANGQIAPTGPQAPPVGGRAAGGTLEVYIWVVQPPAGEKGPFMWAKGEPDPANPNTRWRTPAAGTVAVHSQHQFHNGPALGMGVLVWKDANGNVTNEEWWFDVIALQ